MVGTVEIDIRNRELGYKFSLNRKYSILEGNSASGKSELCNIFSFYNNDRDFRELTSLRLSGCKGVRVASDLTDRFYDFVSSESGYLILVDEREIANLKIGNNAKILNNSDNYFLFISRSHLGYLAYSYLAVFILEKTIDSGTVINILKNRYSSSDLHALKPSLIITEDTKAGYQFYDKTVKCLVKSSEGKSDVINKIRKYVKQVGYVSIYAIVDGAAFGSEISTVYRYLTSKKFLSNGKVVNVFLPESFEYLLLKTGEFEIEGLEDILKNTQNYCDAKKYVSWERYFTHLMKSVGYSKSSLSKGLLNKELVKKVYTNIPDLDKAIIKEDDFT